MMPPSVSKASNLWPHCLHLNVALPLKCSIFFIRFTFLVPIYAEARTSCQYSATEVLRKPWKRNMTEVRAVIRAETTVRHSPFPVLPTGRQGVSQVPVWWEWSTVLRFQYVNQTVAEATSMCKDSESFWNDNAFERKSCSSVDIPIRRSVHVAFDAEEPELQAIVELGVLRMTFKAAADGHLLEVVGSLQ